MMGTRITIAFSGVTAERAAPGFDAAFAQFEHVERVMNEWKPDSVLSRINARAGARGFVPAPADLCEVLIRSLDAANRSGGIFDPTWAALRDVWRFGSAQEHRVPAEAAVKAACPLVSYRNVELRRTPDGTCDVRLRKAGMKLGLGGVAKGWAVDKAVAALRVRGFKDFFIQAGGDLYAAGRREGQPWRVGIRDPRGPEGQYFARLEVSDAAFSTSGDYERFFIANGTRYHHLIDPRTCHPAPASRSATVLAPTALEAEFLTKVTFILGGPVALDAAKAWGAAAVLVTGDNEVLFSPSLEGKLEHWAPTP
jgi:thiamine biosynthesis lipoprotein